MSPSGKRYPRALVPRLPFRDGARSGAERSHGAARGEREKQTRNTTAKRGNNGRRKEQNVEQREQYTAVALSYLLARSYHGGEITKEDARLVDGDSGASRRARAVTLERAVSRRRRLIATANFASTVSQRRRRRRRYRSVEGDGIVALKSPLSPTEHAENVR